MLYVSKRKGHGFKDIVLTCLSTLLHAIFYVMDFG